MRFLITTIFFCFPVFSIAQLDSLKGPIRSINETVNQYSFGELILTLDGHDFGQYSFNQRSALSELKQYNLFPWFPKNQSLKFDRNKQLIESTRAFGSDEDSMTFTDYYKYDDLKKIIQKKTATRAKKVKKIIIADYHYKYLTDSTSQLKIIHTHSEYSERFNVTEHFYNKNGLLIQTKEKGNPDHNFTRLYAYDSAARIILRGLGLIRTHIRSEDGIEISIDSIEDLDWEEYKYTSNGLLIEHKVPLGFHTNRTVYEYDVKNRLAKKYFYYHHYDSLYSIKVFDYNNDGSLKRSRWFGKNDVESMNFVEYFYNDNEISKVTVTDNKRSSSIEFIYKKDRYGNWIEQKKYANGTLLYIRSRKITYW